MKKFYKINILILMVKYIVVKYLFKIIYQMVYYMSEEMVFQCFVVTQNTDKKVYVV
jgi:hypothetical protein